MARPKKYEGMKQIQFRLDEETVERIDEVARSLGSEGVSRTDAVRYLAKGGTAKAPQLPHYGDVPCGPGQMLFDQPPAVQVDLGGLFRGPDRFLLTAKGTSMTGQGIRDGDYLVIRRADSAEHGQIVVASVDGAATLKILREVKSGRKAELWLHPDGEGGQAVKMDGDRAEVIGVLIGVVRKL